MHTFWFCAVALMIAAYVILDGFDLGAGIIHLWVARTEEERRRVLESIGPFWDGNEVWLLAAGGTLFCAFPVLYSASFSGFYLPLMVVLWLLMLRGIAIEFRAHVEGVLWRPLWDVVFCGASALLAIFFGAALGNVVRGVPLGASGFFFLPLWSDFGVNGELGILDWYTVVMGVAAFATLMLHGALWVAFRTEGELATRCRELAARVWWAVAGLAVVITALSFLIQPQLWISFSARPWGFVFPAAGVVALVLVRVWIARGTSAAFLASCGFIAAMLVSAAFGLYPYVLVARGDAQFGLTISNAAAAGYGLRAGVWWFVPGMVLAVGYFVFTYWRFAGKTGAANGQGSE